MGPRIGPGQVRPFPGQWVSRCVFLFVIEPRKRLVIRQFLLSIDIVIYWFPLASNSAAFGQCRYSAINAGKSYWKRLASERIRTGPIRHTGRRGGVPNLEPASRGVLLRCSVWFSGPSRRGKKPPMRPG